MQPTPAPPDSDLLLDFSDADLDAMLRGEGALPAGPPDLPDPSDDLVVLSRRLSGQYVDLLAGFVRSAHALKPGRPGREGIEEPVISALASLVRLNRAVRDSELGDLLESLLALLAEGIPAQQIPRTRFLNRLRELVLQIADLLVEADSARLRDLVLYDRSALPLLDELGNIRGIGPRRLERLYCAGLFTIEHINRADPQEIAEVTAIPLHLAEEIVRVSAVFADRKRRECVEGLQSQVRAFVDAIPRLDPVQDRELIRTAQQALRDLQRALQILPASEPASP